MQLQKELEEKILEAERLGQERDAAHLELTDSKAALVETREVGVTVAPMRHATKKSDSDSYRATCAPGLGYLRWLGSGGNATNTLSVTAVNDYVTRGPDRVSPWVSVLPSRLSKATVPSGVHPGTMTRNPLSRN